MAASLRTALFSTLSLTALTGALTTPAQAQVAVEVAPIRIPLSDINCDWDMQPVDTNFCFVNGSRSTVFTGERRVPFNNNPNLETLLQDYDVTFDGLLQVDGVPVATGPDAVFPNGGFFRDAQFYFDDTAQSVDLSASYTGVIRRTIPVGSMSPDPLENPAFFNQYLNATNTVRAINVDYYGEARVPGNLGEGDSLEYDFRIRSLDPTAISETNSVAVAGTFGLDDDVETAGIQYGRISGTATLVTVPGITPYPDAEFNGAVNTALFSPYALRLDVVAELTTVLNADGLLTPTITVSEGINMLGSRITNLGDGVDVTDAVTLGQLQAAIAAGGALSSGGAMEGSAAAGTGALAAGSGSNADGAGAVALGLGNQATGSGAVAIGDPNLATGTGALAIGADNTATGDGAVALGNLNMAMGNGAVAIGNGANAATIGSVAIGGNAAATAEGSVALGGGSIADVARTVSIGATGAERRIVNLAAGTGATDAVNFGQLTAETTARTQAVTVLTQGLTAETNARIAADTQLSTRITAQETMSSMLASSLTAEQNARIAGDNALALRLDGVDSAIGSLQNSVELLDERITSSTAVATAMSGNAFLPNMTFNLTANVATYDGAHAGSVQIGALVSPNVALNAGVATGFNRNGKTAARAGVTFGF